MRTKDKYLKERREESEYEDLVGQREGVSQVRAGGRSAAPVASEHDAQKPSHSTLVRQRSLQL